MRTSVFPAVLAVALIGPACNALDDTTVPTRFQASLSGAAEVPVRTTPASGTATLTLSGTSIDYTLNVSAITNWTVAHIHVAAAGVSGNVYMNLCGTGAPAPACPATGGTVTGSGTATGITLDSLLSAMRSYNAYVNVHTNDNIDPTNTGPGDFPGGEIRGQIVPRP
jgi:hypothetical protein